MKSVILSILFVLSMTSTSALAQKTDPVKVCEKLISSEAYIGLLSEPHEVRQEAFKGVLICVKGVEGMAKRNDDLAVSLLKFASELPQDAGVILVQITASALQQGAVADYASSQHNLAALHNAKPGSIVADAIRQDDALFMTMTRYAASGKDPRSLFNLAMRLDTVSVQEGRRDPETAYILLTAVQGIARDQGMDHDEDGVDMLASIKAYKDRLGAELGPTAVERLIQTAATFDFTSLAPR